ncbi:hypothetical protein PYCCODRAFT_1446314 [Trametes coccinea BRFM310]|uniref:CCHC-type domain-containing protein n=1 Tax=Trametes coccinea (strain BRFM310) TaxID=1353009 RepID=A0A1Y2IGV5_TRAC3|nr:hypothetical protein PYCCODRAFT_1446314 [Trametes coccinea BRFM310]
MWERPMEFYMHKKFLDTLPEQYENILTLYKGMSPQYTTLALPVWKRAQDAGPRSDNRLSCASGTHNQQQAPRKTANSGFRTANRTVTKTYEQRASKLPMAHDTSQMLGRAGPSKVDRPASQVKCFVCGQIGHYASDPKCPQYGKKNNSNQLCMFAQHVIDETSDKEDNPQVEGDIEANDGEPKPLVPEAIETNAVKEELEYPPSDYGGSQYESEREDNLSPIEDVENDLFFGGMSESHNRTLLMWLYDTKVRKIQDSAAQPKRDELSQRTFSTELSLNGIMALALFDSGCTTDSITPELAYMCKADRIDLKEPVGLQLGTKGSRTCINYSARATLQVGKLKQNQYFDVVDIKYDLILGTTFC